LRFAHISDTHIKNLKYHYEYRIIFEQLYDALRKQQVDYIIHCGDIAHTKTQISPEFVEMCSNFFSSLASIAPTYLILGNHDGNLKNTSRQDALTPIVSALNLPNLHLLKSSGETHLNEQYCLNVLSVFDRDNWVAPTNTDKINIALYHGSIFNSKTDIGWTMTHCEDKISIFEPFDFSFLGDIHRRQFLDREGRILYCGSTVQQNHGETNDKGFTVWNIADKDTFETEHVALKNPKPFITIALTPKGRIPKKTKIPKDARLRLVSNNNLPLNAMKKAVEVAKHRFKPEAISFLNRAAGQRGNIMNLANKFHCENLRDLKVQEKYIAEYLKDYQVSADAMKSIYEFNKKYNQVVEASEDISRNVNWELVEFQWDNLFNYGKDNVVNFANMSGIVGIFGKNYSGKSSIVDSILFTIFNTTSKNERKNLNVINQNRDYGKGRIKIKIGSRLYTIERTATKYIKRLKGEETLEAKTELNFEVYDQATNKTTSLNGITRSQTDAKIRRHFGTIDDFLISSMASQTGALSFINEGSTKRKEIIAKFLDLEFFEKKFKLVKEDSVGAKVLLKKLSGRDYQKEIIEAKKELTARRKAIATARSAAKPFEKRLAAAHVCLVDISKEIAEIPSETINICSVKKELKATQNRLLSLSETANKDRIAIAAKTLRLQKISELANMLNYDSLKATREEIIDIENESAALTNELESASEKEKLLSGIPCGTAFPACKFIRDANSAAAIIPELMVGVKELQKRLSDLKPAMVIDHIDKYNRLERERTLLSGVVGDLKMTAERSTMAIERLNNKSAELEKQVMEYNENKEAIKKIEKLLIERKTCSIEIATCEKKIKSIHSEALALSRLVGSMEQKVNNIEQQQKEFLNLQAEYSVYDLYMRCLHPNGIAYDIIKNKLPIINGEIAKVLSNIVDFEVFFESSGNKFDIFIKHPSHEARPIEMASGAEKTMAAMAIRLSLLSVSSLPKGDLFILDEPGTSLDEENMEGFIRILELIKVYFKNVLLISHLDSLKDCSDIQIVIERKNGYARVNQ